MAGRRGGSASGSLIKDGSANIGGGSGGSSRGRTRMVMGPAIVVAGRRGVIVGGKRSGTFMIFDLDGATHD